jgi:hypothetical protein
MSNNSFRFSQKIVGQERKAIASVIAEALEGQVRYAGAPEFLYEIKDEKSAGSWTIDRDSVVHSPKISLNEIKTIRSVIDTLNVEGFSAEGTMTITLSLEGFSAISLENLNNMLASKETLIKKAMLIEGELVVLAENDEISFPFWNATLNADEVQTYITLAKQMAEQAKLQKRVLRKEKPTDNEKYAFRCFLLRLGFIGDNFKTERKVLLSRLSGNGAYRKGKKFSIIVVAEGAYPQGGEMVVQNYVPTSHDPIRLGGIGQKVAEEISAKLKNIEIRVTVLGHLQRGGAPVPFDRVLATRYGVAAVKAFMDGQYGKMVSLRGTEITTVALEDAIKEIRKIDPNSDLVHAARAVGISFGDFK